jgi:hypothetical protein
VSPSLARPGYIIMKTTMPTLARTIIAAVAGLLVSATVQAQSLGDVARQQREKREKDKKAGGSVQTYTDADLAKHRSDADPLTPAVTSGSPPPTSAAARPDASQQQEDDWRRQVAFARARIDAAQRYVDSLKDEWWLPGRRVTGELQRRNDDAEQQLKAAKEALERLEESARRAGVPPGWLR